MLTRIGPYQLAREIGRGGMGVVYLGHDPRLDRAVAIKALPEHLASDPDRLARFTREARTLAQLSHPNVAGIFGVEEHDGASYLVLEYVEGETLAARLSRGPLPLDQALRRAIEMADALDDVVGVAPADQVAEELAPPLEGVGLAGEGGS